MHSKKECQTAFIELVIDGRIFTDRAASYSGVFGSG